MVSYDWESESQPSDGEWNDSRVSSNFWFASLIVTGLLCLVFRSPVAAAFFPVLSTAQSSIQAAMWIRRADPHRRRAVACSRFLYATGCWKAFISGIVAFMMLGILTVILGRNPPEEHIIASLLVVGFTAVSISAVGLWALCTAWFSRVQVWVHPKLKQLARQDFANLSQLKVHPGVSNHAVYVSAVSLAIPPMAAGTGWMVYAAMMAPDVKDMPSIAGGLAVVLGGPALAVLFLVSTSSRLFAAGPAECWSIRSDADSAGH